MDRSQVIASLVTIGANVSSSNPLELLVFNTEQLASLDSVDDVTDGTIELETVMEQESPEVWHLSFGQLTTDAFFSYVGCAGDFDGDGFEDITVSLTNYDGQNQRGQILLIARADFAALDRLDGEEDKRVEVDRLWPND